MSDLKLGLLICTAASFVLLWWVWLYVLLAIGQMPQN